MQPADRLGRAHALVAPGGRHADVDNGDVRARWRRPARAARLPVPAWATTRIPASSSSRAMPSRTRMRVVGEHDAEAVVVDRRAKRKRRKVDRRPVAERAGKALRLGQAGELVAAEVAHGGTGECGVCSESRTWPPCPAELRRAARWSRARRSRRRRRPRCPCAGPCGRARPPRRPGLASKDARCAAAAAAATAAAESKTENDSSARHSTSRPPWFGDGAPEERSRNAARTSRYSAPRCRTSRWNARCR